MTCTSLVLAILMNGTSRPSNDTHYHFAGPFSNFCPDGVKPGAPTSGLTFDLVISDNGNTLAGTRIELKAPDWHSPIQLSLGQAKYESGEIKGRIQLKNQSGLVLAGLRFDCDGATETYLTKDADGKPIYRDRQESVSIPSPILLGDVQNKDSADEQDFDASGIKFSPETKQVNVHFRLSGLSLLRDFKNGGGGPGFLALDSKGRIYKGDRDGVWRSEVDGSKPSFVTKYGDYTIFGGVDPKTDDIIGGVGNGNRFTRRSSEGDDISLIPLSEEFDHTPGNCCFRANGDLYVLLDNAIVIYRNGKEIQRANKVGDVPFSYENFDVSPDGTVSLPSQGSIYVMAPDWKTAKRISLGPDWHLGRFMRILGVRRDSYGNLYVSEIAYAESNEEAPRISVFDSKGHFVRVFGRGDRTPNQGDAPSKPGQLVNVCDMLFGPDGTLYISSDRENLGIVSVFKPF